MRDDDDNSASKPSVTPAIDLSTFSVEDLERHIATLRAEIERAEAVLVEKRRYQDAAAALFRKG